MKRVIHFHAKYIKRSAGGSVVGFAAYCAGERLQNQYDGRIHYKKRTDVIFKTILLPPNAPEIYKDREVLWNAVEMIENGKAQIRNSSWRSSPEQSLKPLLSHCYFLSS